MMGTRARSTSALVRSDFPYSRKPPRDFMPTSMQDAAHRAIEARQRIELSVHDSQAFTEAVDNPQPVNNRLRDTVRLYRRAAGI
jgi:uncharacterized protein (DUF1778 family)